MSNQGGDEAMQTVMNFLETNLPKSEVPNIESELKKDFVFAKSRGKIQKKKKKKKTICLSRKEKKSLGFYDIPRNSVQYEDVAPMHEIWIDYITKMLELEKPIPDCSSKSWETFSQTLYKADYHGSMLHVVRSKCPSYVGKKGICIMDTRNTFKIVSNNNTTTTIPKKECVFELCVGKFSFTLFGKQLCVRPAERSTKKVKCQSHPDL